jgi:predicted ester cyclase
MPGQAAGPEGLKQMSTMMRTAFPDLQVTTEDLIGEGDKVVGRFTARGTHRGEFMGAAPTNKVITMQEIHIGRCYRRKAGGALGLEGSLWMMQQMGLIPETG